MKCEIYQALAALRADSRIGPAVRGCFEFLWHLAGGRPDYLTIRTAMIAKEFNVDRRAVQKWLDRLSAFSLIEIVGRNKREGRVDLYVFHPRPEARRPRPDPQRRLPFAPVASEGRPDLCAPKGLAEDVLPRVRAIDDSDDDDKEKFSSSSSLSLSAADPMPRAIQLRRQVFPRERFVTGLPHVCHRDSVFLVSAAILANALGTEGDDWLNQAVEATNEAKPKADKVVRYLRACLREGVCTQLGQCQMPQVVDEFGRMLRGVRPTAERAVAEYNQKVRAARAAATERSVGP